MNARLHKSSHCLLQAKRNSEFGRVDSEEIELLGALTQKQLQWLKSEGYSLRRNWDRSWNHVLGAQFGQRYYLSHQDLFASKTTLASVICSRLGRNRSRQRDWPRLLESILRHCLQRGWTLLDCPYITLADEVREFARAAEIPLAKVILPERSTTSLGKWMLDCYERLTKDSKQRKYIFLSPMGEAKNHSANPHFNATLSDRISVFLPDFVAAIALRSGGTLNSLAEQRLGCSDYRPASLIQCIGSSAQHRLCDGAVGWHVVPGQNNENSNEYLEEDCTHQLCCRLPNDFGQSKNTTWLNHCTRANFGKIPGESKSKYSARMFIQGETGTGNALDALKMIARSGYLLGNSFGLRTKESSISFSSVPLAELLKRRVFRSHLGRWDWEPYGLSIKRIALEKQGCRPVIYGDDTLFQSLQPKERKYFQSEGKDGQWRQECEWRCFGRISLSSLSSDDVRYFVKTKTEALELSKTVNSAVFWLAD